MPIILSQLGVILANGMKVDYYQIPEFGTMYSATVEVSRRSPEHLECPDYWDEIRSRRIFIIDSDSTNYQHWSGRRVHWNNVDWILTAICVAVPSPHDKRGFVIDLETVKYRRMKMLVK